MRPNVVSAADYPHLMFSPSVEGFNTSDEALATMQAALNKAISAGSGTDSAAFTGGRSLVVESLEQTLVDVLWSEKHIRAFKLLKSSPTAAIVDEWTVRDDYGSEFGGATTETANPPEHTASLARKFETVCFYRTKRGVSHPMTLMQTINPAAEVEEEQSGTRQLLGMLERDIFVGDQSVYPQRIKGLQSIITAQGGDLVLDAHGQPVTTQDKFLDLAATVYNEGGDITHCFLHPQCQADINAALAPAQRIVLPVQGQDGRITVGANQTSLAHASGVMDFEIDRFVRAGWLMKAPAAAVGPENGGLAPATPTIGTVTGNGGAIADQRNLPAGDYYVKVSAVCENGESAATAASAAVTLTAGNAIQITVTPGGGGAPTTGYRVYLSAKGAADGSDCRFYAEYPATGSQQVLTVDGTWVTGSTCLYLLSMDPADRAIDWRQLFPMTRFNLAITAPVIPFLVMIYGYLRVMKPSWHGMIKNVIPSEVEWDPFGS